MKPSNSTAGLVLGLLLALTLIAAACSSDGSSSDTASPSSDESSDETSSDETPSDGTAEDASDDEPAADSSGDADEDSSTGGSAEDSAPVIAAGEFNAPGSFGEPPPIPDDYDTSLDAALDVVFGDGLPTASFAFADRESLQALEDSGDPRLAWYMADLIRFFGTTHGSLLTTAEALTGLELSEVSPWGDLTDHLIAWDVPAPPNYARYKRALFSEVEPQWASFFEDDFTDRQVEVDYRFWVVGWRWYRRPAVRGNRRTMSLHPCCRQPRSHRCRGRRLVRRRPHRIRCRDQRRGPGLSPQHHGNPGDGQRHPRWS